MWDCESKITWLVWWSTTNPYEMSFYFMGTLTVVHTSVTWRNLASLLIILANGIKGIKEQIDDLLSSSTRRSSICTIVLIHLYNHLSWLSNHLSWSIIQSSTMIIQSSTMIIQSSIFIIQLSIMIIPARSKSGSNIRGYVLLRENVFYILSRLNYLGTDWWRQECHTIHRQR